MLEQPTLHTCGGVVPLEVDVLEPLQTSALAHYTPCYLCDSVPCVGSMRFDVLEPPRTMHKYPTPLSISVLVWFVTFDVLEPPRTSA